jgi:hypothetical protein
MLFINLSQKSLPDAYREGFVSSGVWTAYYFNNSRRFFETSFTPGREST